VSAMTTCPDCGAEVVKTSAYLGHYNRVPVLAERCDDGPWVMLDLAEDPTPYRHKNAAEHHGQQRWRLHPCSRRALVADDLPTIAGVYGRDKPRKQGPAVNIPLSKIDGDNRDLEQGDRLTVYDGAGNEIRATVERVEFVARLDLSTLKRAAS
jgi:hypothetical protein